MSEGDRNVFILGAGFSAAAGAPLLPDFLDRAREFFDNPSSGLNSTQRAQFNNVFEFRRKMSQAREKIVLDLDNIENLFGLVEISKRLGQTDTATRQSTVYLIAKTLELSLKPPEKRGTIGFDYHGREPLPPAVFRKSPDLGRPTYYSAETYDFFAALIAGCFDEPDRRPNRTSAVITFNYDLVLDDALSRQNLTVDYRLKPGTSPANSIPILKLHGSANWIVCDKCRQIQVLTQKLASLSDDLSDVACKACGINATQLLLVPPSWDKSEHQESLSEVWKKAVEELQSATRIFVIGYSIPESDAFFRFLMTLALSQNHRLYRMEVIDFKSQSNVPMFSEIISNETNPVEKRYRELLEPLFASRRFSFDDGGFEMFLSNSSISQRLGRAEKIANLTRF